MQYNAAVTDWNKYTGGGSGLETEFERWDSAKLDKYNIDAGDYNHSNVASRPLILFDMYSKSKEPFLTVIRLWDNATDNLLCSKYDPINIGSGEVGMTNETNDDTSTCTSTYSGSASKEKKSKNTVEESAVGLQYVIKSIKK